MGSVECVDDFNPHILFVIDATSPKGNMEMSRYHTHDFVEFSIVVSGRVEYRIEEEMHVLEAGDVMIFNPGIYHQEIEVQSIQCTQVHIGIGKLKPLQRKEPILTTQKYRREIQTCVEAIQKEQRVRPLAHSSMLKAKVMELIVWIEREMEKGESKETDDGVQVHYIDKKMIVQKMIDYMEEHYQQEVSLQEIADNMYLSPVYASKIFKEETKTSPINYLIQIRMTKAKEILEKGHLPIHVVATQVGYADAYYFSKLFKKYYGMAPSYYMKQHEEKKVDERS